MKKIAIIAVLLILAGGAYFYSNYPNAVSEVQPASVVSTSTPTAQQQQTPPADLWVSPEGKVMGYIKRLSDVDGRVTVEFDYARIFFGDDVPLAMEEDGECSRTKDDCLNISGYHIRNKDQSTEALTVSPQASVTPSSFCTTWEVGERPLITLQDFVKNFRGVSTCANNLNYAFSATSTYPYWITRNSSGEITSITQQFIP